MEKEVILALSFGKPSTTTANKFIAQLIEEEFKKPNSNIRLVMNDKCIPFAGWKGGEMILLGSEDEDVHCSTLDLLEEAVGHLCYRDRVVLISEPRYLARVMRDLRHVIKAKGLEVAMRPVREKEGNKIWYDQKSTQKRAKIPWLFALWEAILMNIPWWLYEKATKS